MSNSVLLPPVYFGNITYFALIAQSDSYAYHAEHKYQKQTYRNRCEILGANGIIKLTIPVKKVNGNQTILNEILISEEENWKQIHLRSIQSAYQSAPFYEHYSPKIFELIQNAEGKLVDFNEACTKLICSFLNLNKNIEADSQSNVEDFKWQFSPKTDQPLFNFPTYFQVFDEKFGFKENLSILDLLFNMGPESVLYLKTLKRIEEK